jgi:hypothetical protein
VLFRATHSNVGRTADADGKADLNNLKVVQVQGRQNVKINQRNKMKENKPNKLVVNRIAYEIVIIF